MIVMKEDFSLTKEEKRAIVEYKIKKGLPESVGITFGDVYVPERYSDIRSRAEISDFSVKIAGGLEFGIPFVSANMEPVTGVQMAVGFERERGLGLLPQTLPIEDRLYMLERIKRTDCAFIENPLEISPEATLGEAKILMKKFSVSSLILTKGGKPEGILTHRDWRFEKDESKKVKSLAGALGKKLITAPRGTAFKEAEGILIKNKIEKLPLLDKSGSLAGLITAHGLFYKISYPLATRDAKGRFLLAGSIGVGQHFTDKHLKEVELQAERGIKILLVDTARAFGVNIKEAIYAIRRDFPGLILIVGNVSSAEGAKALFEWGAHIVKVNQGRGHVCRTSKMGVGQPQLSAIAECAVVAKKYGGKIIADGGMKNPGDLVKAVVAGADLLMSGFLLAGTYESAAPIESDENGSLYKTYKGSASLEAQLERIKNGTLDRIREPEGIAEKVPVTGSLHDKIRSLMDGMRSAMSYSGVRSLSELKDKGVFELQTEAGLKEGTKR